MRRSGSARTSPKAKSDSTAPSVCAILLLLVTGQAHGQQTAPNANASPSGGVLVLCWVGGSVLAASEAADVIQGPGLFCCTSSD